MSDANEDPENSSAEEEDQTDVESQQISSDDSRRQKKSSSFQRGLHRTPSERRAKAQASQAGLLRPSMVRRGLSQTNRDRHAKNNNAETVTEGSNTSKPFRRGLSSANNSHRDNENQSWADVLEQREENDEIVLASIQPTVAGAFASTTPLVRGGPVVNQEEESAEIDIVVPPIPPPLDNTDLVEARAVTEEVSETNLLQAQEVDPEYLERKARERRKNKECLAIGFCISAISLAILIATVFGTSSSKDSIELALPTLVPSTSSSPSESPSLAPARAFDLFVEKLPEGTRSSLANGRTPQRQALDWLEQHPNITAIPEWRQTQLFALATLYYSMDGENWRSEFVKSWLSYGINECNWQSNEFGTMQYGGTYVQVENLPDWQKPRGIDPCNDQGRIQNLFLILSQGPTGLQQPTIPPEVALLTSLSILALPINWIRGPLPTEIYQMDKLAILHLKNHNLDGPLPGQFGQMTSLKELDLSSGTLRGSMPSQLGLMASMETLLLERNRLTGVIPRQLGQLTTTTQLLLGRNQLTGLIPSELGTMTNIVELSLPMNSLNGTLPSELGQITKISDLNLQYNSLTGFLPSELGRMTHLADLDLSGNGVSGPLPSELGGMTNLEVMDIRWNSLFGPLPSQLGLMTSTIEIWLSTNTLSGSIPSELGVMTSMELLHLGDNSLTGELPSELGLLSNLVELDLSTNDLTGSIPSEFGLMINATTVHLNDNALTGTIPWELEELVIAGSIESLYLGNNSFSGVVPEGLCLLGMLDNISWVGLSFDCSGQLCGCCWCPCPGSNYSTECDTGPGMFDPFQDDDN